MSCHQKADDSRRACVDHANVSLANCVGDAKRKIRRCSEEAQRSRQGCAEWADDRHRECSEWGEESQSKCSAWTLLSWACAVVVWVVERVCHAYTWVVTQVCIAYETVVETFCTGWEWVVIGVCSVGTAVNKGLCWLVNLVQHAICFVSDFVTYLTAHIVQSDDDEPPAESLNLRLFADSISIAAVDTALDYKDSGKHYSFRIDNGVVKVATPEGWIPIAPDGEKPQAISYKLTRKPPRGDAPTFDMVAANSGRIFAKEAGYARFYLTMLDHMFLFSIRARPVDSTYFKLDPEQGLRTARNADRLAQLAGSDSPHPAAVRFPLFRQALKSDLNDTMIVNLDHRNLKVWHRIDARPPKDGGDPPDHPGFPRPEVVVRYQSGFSFLPAIDKKGYRIRKVLDIGVGHEHWHEQRCSIYGGEMDSLDGSGLPPCLPGREVYRLFNGPIDDQGGFIDGTVNYYVLAQLEDDPGYDKAAQQSAFGILWLDEQAVLSERWRLLDPADAEFGLIKQLIPSAMIQYLEYEPATFHFDLSRYWCPMRAGFVTLRSRMAVSRQVVILSGRDPSTNMWELYSINFSFGTCDRTWRWRRLPPLESGGAECPEEFGLREDMILFVKESRRTGTRYWFQRYLPACGDLSPDSCSLFLRDKNRKAKKRDLNTPKPTPCFTHPWQWLPQDVFQFAHEGFSHFGCYEASVDWRWQYYRVTPIKGEDLLRTLPETTSWHEIDHQLFIVKDSVNWSRLNNILKGGADPEVSRDTVQRLLLMINAAPAGVGGAITGAVFNQLLRDVSSVRDSTAIQRLLCQIYNDLKGSPLIINRHHNGLFHEQFLLSLRFRKPLSWIMTHWDKRDDDLLPFRDMGGKSGGTRFEVTLRTTCPPHHSLQLLVESYHKVLHPPAVTNARVAIVRSSSTAVTLRIKLLPKTVPDLDENIWRIKIGRLTRTQGVLTGSETLFNEIRREATHSVIASDGWHTYEWDLSKWAAAAVERVIESCNERARQRFGTSVWFEDVVGHVAIPDEIVFETMSTNATSNRDTHRVHG